MKYKFRRNGDLIKIEARDGDTIYGVVIRDSVKLNKAMRLGIREAFNKWARRNHER